MDCKSTLLRKPYWLKIKKLPAAGEYALIKSHLRKNHLNTICESGNCPNIGECWAAGTATFMILGDICTRNCKFCAVEKGKPLNVDTEEPKNIANVIAELKLHHCVITSVTRDDLKDGGANHWAETVKQIKALSPGTTIETLVPDFDGNVEALDIVINSRPDIISHNMETVKRLTQVIRVKADYDLSLNVINRISSSGIRSKSGFMLGLGETEVEVIEAIKDLYSNGCRILTIGQYLQPTVNNHPVFRYVDPEDFARLKQAALDIGFEFVESGPFVRSSYHAEKHIV
jgi:lipoic acid synthetase